MYGGIPRLDDMPGLSREHEQLRRELNQEIAAVNALASGIESALRKAQHASAEDLTTEDVGAAQRASKGKLECWRRELALRRRLTGSFRYARPTCRPLCPWFGAATSS